MSKDRMQLENDVATPSGFTLNSPCEPPLNPPKLVRGLSATAVSDHAGLVALVVRALSDDPGWAAIKDFASVEVKDCSGWGGSKTFKITAPFGKEPSPCPQAVALHTRPTDHADHLMRRMSAATLAFSRANVAPPRIAEGGDWFLESWEAESTVLQATPEDWRKIGQLLARIHQIPTEWFERPAEEILSKSPQAVTAPKGSHAWIFLARIFPCKGCLQDAEIFAEWAEPGPLAPTHPIGRRIVTTHGDFHPGNLINSGGDKGLKVVDFEFACVTNAIFDLTFGSFCCGSDAAKQDAFLQGYTENLNDVNDLEILKVDIKLARLAIWLPGGMIPGWDIDGLPSQTARDKINTCKQFAGWIRESKERQAELLQKGLQKMMREYPAFRPEAKMRNGSWYPLMQSKLEGALAKGCPNASDVDVAANVSSGAELLIIKAHADQTKALQVRSGTSRLELGNFEVGCRNQQWLKIGVALQHVGTGLFLDCEIKYMYHDRGANWESCGSELFVRPRDVESCRQQWFLEFGISGAHMIRHMVDGRVVDINFWSFQVGNGVNVNVPHSFGEGVLWAIDGLKEERAVGTWAEYSNIDMCGQGDIRCIPDWKDVATLENLKTIVEQNGFSAVTVSAGEPSFSHAALKKFSYPLTPAHCKPITECCNHPCTIHIWTPASPPPPTNTKRTLVPSIAPDIPDGASFSIKVACSRDYCLSYRSDGYTKDPFEVYLAKFDGNAKQMWRLVGGDQIQNVEAGLFLHTDVLYPYLFSLEAPWENNHSDLVLREQNFSDEQRWVYGPEEFHGGKILRHYNDGRAVDVHGWNVANDGNNIGCENSVHGDCKGISYIFEISCEPSTCVGQ